MKRIVLFCAALLCLAHTAYAGSDKIDPREYICAEYLATISIEHAPPLFEALQIDGYTAAKSGKTVAFARIMPSIMLEVYALCQSQPEAKVYPLWNQVRSRLPLPDDGLWRADSTTCASYNAAPDDGSGFVIWLDGYIRGKDDNDASVLKRDKDLNSFFKGCKREPSALMQDVMRKHAK